MQPTLAFLNVQWDASKRLITIGDKAIQLTRIEYRLLSILQYNAPVSYEILALCLYNCDVDPKTRAAMDKHIDRIRGKLRETNISIHCVVSYGYVLLFNAKEKPQGCLPR